MTTMREARASAKRIGMHISCVDDEYRVTTVSGTREQQERRAYYTSDLEDALGTMYLMHVLHGTREVCDMCGVAVRLEGGHRCGDCGRNI